ncbi:hypothetical protein [Granulicoccus phenolivorans]|uniref:hypothetical protein n=1 Tax=Granulicoccus phenolivorans TaxID=266854 RepID=UPI0004147B6D|nr:hypothetical protein [Granulicoccus phenolivorans]
MSGTAPPPPQQEPHYGPTSTPVGEPAYPPSATGEPAYGAQQLEWQITEQVPGDPFTAELVVWPGDALDGIAIPLQGNLLEAVSDVRRRQGGAFAMGNDAMDRDTLDSEAEASDSTEGQRPRTPLLARLSRSTGADQADRWLSNIPVKYQIGAAAAVLVVFLLIMLIGSLR